MSNQGTVWRTVQGATLHEDLRSFLTGRRHTGYSWTLRLECGHDVHRRVTYKRRRSVQYGRHRRRPIDEVCDPPRMVKCDACKFHLKITTP